jgi:hypothetical protein
MNDPSNRPYNARAAAARYAVYAGIISLGLCAALIIVGTRTQANAWAFLAAGGLGIIITVGLVGVGLAIAEHGGSQSEGFEQQIGELTRAVSDLREQGSLSEGARRVLNRRRDRDVLRAAIEEDLATEEWDAAMVLVDELADQFGYRADAEEFRARIEQARHDTVQRKVNEGTQRVDELLVQRRWDIAMGEALRLRRLYPESGKAQVLGDRVEHARLIYKSDLERRFLQSAEENRVEDAMAFLRELDAYLTEQEAEPYREVARGVIGKARENLGARFKIAVQDHRWQEAAQLGDQIIEQFPNSRMAGEVRELLDTIRTRARSMNMAG